MKILKELYYILYRATSRPAQRARRYGGHLQAMIRDEAARLCAGADGRLLEIGSGSGLFVERLAALRPSLEIWGIDTDKDTLSEAASALDAKGLGNVHLEAQDAASLRFPDGSFDTVVCINLFLNTGFEGMAAVLGEMKRVCRSSGRIIFEYRSSRNPLFVLKYRLAMFYDGTVPGPLYVYDPAKVDRLVVSLGLRVTSRKFLGFPVRGLAPIVMMEAVKP